MNFTISASSSSPNHHLRNHLNHNKKSAVHFPPFLGVSFYVWYSFRYWLCFSYSLSPSHLNKTTIRPTITFTPKTFRLTGKFVELYHLWTRRNKISLESIKLDSFKSLMSIIEECLTGGKSKCGETSRWEFGKVEGTTNVGHCISLSFIRAPCLYKKLKHTLQYL